MNRDNLCFLLRFISTVVTRKKRINFFDKCPPMVFFVTTRAFFRHHIYRLPDSHTIAFIGIFIGIFNG